MDLQLHQTVDGVVEIVKENYLACFFGAIILIFVVKLSLMRFY